jgi:hypothetical protein
MYSIYTVFGVPLKTSKTLGKYTKVKNTISTKLVQSDFGTATVGTANSQGEYYIDRE